MRMRIDKKRIMQKWIIVVGIAIFAISIILLSLFIFKHLNGNIVRDNGTYIRLSTCQVFDEVPAEVLDGDVYLKGDYAYIYCPTKYGVDGWHVELATKELIESNFNFNGAKIVDHLSNYTYTTCDKTSYGEILAEIGDKQTKCLYKTFEYCKFLTNAPTIPKSVIDMSYTFNGCEKLIQSPIIPSSVTNLHATFVDCVSLKQAPIIPCGVEDMNNTFSGCDSLITAPVIPDGVKYMGGTFSRCNSLTEAPSIPGSVVSMRWAFSGCENFKKAPPIPCNVLRIDNAFEYCTSLTGSIEINASPYSYEMSFEGVDFKTQKLSLIGQSSQIDYIGTTGNSYCIECNGFCEVGHKSVLESGTYYVGVTSNKVGNYTGATATYVAGDGLPMASKGDVYVNGNYEYKYGYEYKNEVWTENINSTYGWGVRCLVNTNTPGEIIQMINDKYVIDLSGTFYGCSELIQSPTIPLSVVNMVETFSGCENLIEAPEIPDGVTLMIETFYDCSNLRTVHRIPGSVSSMMSAFAGCGSLTGTIEINTTDTVCSACFAGVDMRKINITGEITNHIEMLNEIGSTGDNWTSK